MQKNSSPESKVNSKISEIGTCEVCGLDNAHLIFRCPKCGYKFCLELCEELMDDHGLCVWCQPRIVPYTPKS